MVEPIFNRLLFGFSSNSYRARGPTSECMIEVSPTTFQRFKNQTRLTRSIDTADKRVIVFCMKAGGGSRD
jgi:hypothetical protein